MNLVFVGNLPPHPGGSGTASAQMLIGLGRLGHKVHALAPITAGILRSGDEFATRYPGLVLHRYVIDEFLIDPWNGFPARIRKQEMDAVRYQLPALIEGVLPDVVIVGRESFAGIAHPILQQYGVPGLLIAHGALKVVNTDANLAIGEYPLRALQGMDALAVASRHMCELARQLEIPAVCNIPNAVDTSRFSPAEKSAELLRAMGLTEEHAIVLHASNMKSVKRVSDIILAAASVVRDRPSVRFLMVGDGPEKTALMEQCRSLKLERQFRFTGWVNHEQLPQYVNLADMVLMCSETENQPMVVLESQACAKPVLATDIPGHRELVTHGESGILFPVGDHQLVVSAIVDLIDDPRRRLALGLRGLESVQRHEIMSVASQYEKLLCAIAARRYSPVSCPVAG